MDDKIFRRVEKKYLLTQKQYERLIKRLIIYLEKDTFFESTICNIYFDTKDDDLIIKSIEKPLFKEKIRLRSYNTPKMNSTVFFEIKNKYKGIVGKRRVNLTLNDFYKYLETGVFDENNQIMREIDYHLHHYKVYPKLFLAYDRQSYKGKDDNNFRVTFDSNLRSRRSDLRLEIGSQGNLYFDEPHYIMEVKTLGSMPLWFTKIITEEKIFPHSFSKYGNIYKKECGITC